MAKVEMLLLFGHAVFFSCFLFCSFCRKCCLSPPRLFLACVAYHLFWAASVGLQMSREFYIVSFFTFGAILEATVITVAPLAAYQAYSNSKRCLPAADAETLQERLEFLQALQRGSDLLNMPFDPMSEVRKQDASAELHEAGTTKGEPR